MLGLTIELISWSANHRNELSNPPKNPNTIAEISDTLASQSLTLLGLIFTGTTFILSNDVINSSQTIMTLFSAMGLMFLSFQSRNLTGDKEFYFLLQDKSLSWGLISLILGITLLAIEVRALGGVMMWFILSAVLVLYWLESVLLDRAYNGRKEI